MYDYRVYSLTLASTLAATSVLALHPAVAADWTTQTAVGLDLGLGGVITPYRPDAQDGGSDLLISVRGSYDFGNDLALQVLLRQWSLPGSNHATMPGVGGRFEPLKSSIGRGFLDAAVGPAWTQDRVAPAFDVGVGYELDVSLVPGLCLGPFFRYGQVINPANRSSDDGRAWALGLSGTFRIGPWSAAAAAERAHAPNGGKPVRAFQFKVQDSDHDGVSDERDQCPEVPAGRHPDAFRAGCPENDEDNDGIPDSDDACPTDPMGDTPDPKRKGCPFTDSDGDGIADEDDHCPDKPGPKTEDPSTNGCPRVRKAAPMPEEREPPPSEETTRDLKPVSKRRLSRPAPRPPQE
jgi:hypothetical protein